MTTTFVPDPNTPADLAADNRTVPYGVGYDMARDLPKDAWRELAVDLLRAQLGEGAPVGELRAEITERMDALRAAGYVGQYLPRSRYPRRDET